MPAPDWNRTSIFAGVALSTMAVLMLELTLTRLFSATMYYHFAFMAISVALLGSGASGVFIYVVQHRLDPARTGGWLSLAAIGFALSIVLSLGVILAYPLTLEPGSENYIRLAKVYCATAVPFFFAGCVVTLAITRLARDITSLYMCDLGGAALGCLVLIPVLNAIGAINTVLLVAMLAGAGAVCFGISAGAGRAHLVLALTVTALLGTLAAYNGMTRRMHVQSSKGQKEELLVFAKWNSFSRVTVQGDPRVHYEIKIDADAATSIPRDGSNLALHQDQRRKIEGLAYHIKPGANVLIIGPGGGMDVVTALVFGAPRITAVEINPIIARDVMSSEPFKSYSGSLYEQDGVSLVVDEGRSFIRGSRESYDIIQATMVDTWAATAAGAFSLSENNLYTVEAFKDYAAHLTEDGLLTMTRWYFQPPDQLLRLVTLTRAMMMETGISDPARHVILVRDASQSGERTPATYIFKKSALTDDEIRTIENVAASNRFEVLYTPLTRPPNVFTRMLEASDPARLWRESDTNVEPPRDNAPFFFNSIRLSNLARALGGASEWQKTNLGTFVLFALLGFTTVLVVIFILGPLLLVRRRAFRAGSPGRLSSVLYFACLGAGFIIVEVAMIQKFILFLGHPVYALAVVLFSLLTFSAIGSMVSGRLADDKLPSALPKLLVGLVALVLLYIVLLSPVFYALVRLALPLRIVIAVVLMAPLAALMGTPMPTGIRILARRAPELIPWAWGVNGAASVMGSVAALVIAILAGFNQALVVGGGLYLLAVVFIAQMQPPGGEAPRSQRVPPAQV